MQLEHHRFLKRQEEQERFNQQREFSEQLRLEQEQKNKWLNKKDENKSIWHF